MDIRIRNIRKSFGDKIVIENLSMDIASGSFTTLLGPSGCGKTTLLRMIAGLEIPDSGEIYLGNRCVFSSERNIVIPPEERGIGFVFQDFALWPHMRVKDNVAFVRFTRYSWMILLNVFLPSFQEVSSRGFPLRVQLLQNLNAYSLMNLSPHLMHFFVRRCAQSLRRLSLREE